MSKILDSICVYAEKNAHKLGLYSITALVVGLGMFVGGEIAYNNIRYPKTEYSEKMKELNDSIKYNLPSLEEILRNDSLLLYYTNTIKELDSLKYLDRVEHDKLTDGYQNSLEYIFSDYASSIGISIVLLDVLFNIGMIALGPYNMRRKNESKQNN